MISDNYYAPPSTYYRWTVGAPLTMRPALITE